MTIFQGYSPSLIAPRKLLTLERLDIAVKWRFFRHLLGGNDADSERIYRWHIEKRTGGQEPRGWKSSIDDYVMVCKDLLESMLDLGFDPDCPIEYGKNGRLRDGAHRLACSLLLRQNVYYVVAPADGNMRWGADWFIQKGIATEDLQRIKANWKWLKHQYGQFI